MAMCMADWDFVTTKILKKHGLPKSEYIGEAWIIFDKCLKNFNPTKSDLKTYYQTSLNFACLTFIKRLYRERRYTPFTDLKTNTLFNIEITRMPTLNSRYLFEILSECLTPNQKLFLEDYFQGKRPNISRQAVGQRIAKIKKRIFNYGTEKFWFLIEHYFKSNGDWNGSIRKEDTSRYH